MGYSMTITYHVAVDDAAELAAIDTAIAGIDADPDAELVSSVEGALTREFTFTLHRETI